MNTSLCTQSIEPGWKSYLTASAFSVPAIAAACFSVTFLVPKLEEIWKLTGFDSAAVGVLLNVVLFTARHGLILLLTVGVIVGLLEWRSRGWPHYRRVSLGIACFLVNTAVLVYLTALFTTAMITAPSLMQLK